MVYKQTNTIDDSGSSDESLSSDSDGDWSKLKENPSKPLKASSSSSNLARIKDNPQLFSERKEEQLLEVLAGSVLSSVFSNSMIKNGFMIIRRRFVDNIIATLNEVDDTNDSLDVILKVGRLFNRDESVFLIVQDDPNSAVRIIDNLMARNDGTLLNKTPLRKKQKEIYSNAKNLLDRFV
jgi:hypothetical protein